MGIEQVSIFFYPPHWKQHAVPTIAKTATAEPVQIVSAIQSDRVNASAVKFELFRDWLLQQGFTVANWGDGEIFDRGKINSILGLQQEIQIAVATENGEVTQLYCRFSLPRSKTLPLSHWSRFILSMCQLFGFKIDQNDDHQFDASQFIAAVKNNQHYKDFAPNFGWGETDRNYTPASVPRLATARRAVFVTGTPAEKAGPSGPSLNEEFDLGAVICL